MATVIEETINDVDKSEWPDGPWKGEPDKVVWVHKDTGLACMVVRHAKWGHWCDQREPTVPNGIRG